MLTPAESFEQQRTVRWLLPSLGCMAVLFMAGTGLSLADALMVAVLLSVPAVILAESCLWLTVFGTRATQVAAVLLAALFTIPLGAGPAALLTHVGDAAVVVGFAAGHAALWVGGSIWHVAQIRRRTSLQTSDSFNASGCQVDLGRNRIGARKSNETSAFGAGRGGMWVGAMSVAAYPVLSAAMGESGLHLLLVCLTNAVSAWLNVAVLARWWADAWYLRTIERRDGVLFVAERLPWLETQRQQSAWGRWLRRQWPLPSGLQADLAGAGSTPPELPSAVRNRSARRPGKNLR